MHPSVLQFLYVLNIIEKNIVEGACRVTSRKLKMCFPLVIIILGLKLLETL